MPITANDLKLLASARMTDNLAPELAGAGGGGPRGSIVLASGTENNVFPDVMPGQRTTGARQARLVYPSVLSNDNDAANALRAGVLARPGDAAADVLAFGTAGMLETTAPLAYYALQRLDQVELPIGTAGTGTEHTGTTNAAGTQVTGLGAPVLAALQVGDKVRVASSGGGSGSTWHWRTVTSNSAGVLGITPAVGSGSPLGVTVYGYAASPLPVSAACTTTASVSAAATALPVNRTDVRLRPQGAGASTPGLIVPVPAWTERWPLFEPGTPVLVRHPSTPTTQEVAVVQRCNHATSTLVLSAPLANAYPTAPLVCPLVTLGLAQAQLAAPPFAQQTWLRTWSGTVAGTPPQAAYSAPVTLVNAGAITGRWAIVFKTATTFDVLNEQLGRVAGGSISTNFSPLNPATNEPYFTLQAWGWGGGWVPGNTLRFDTLAAEQRLWCVRNVDAGSAPSGLVNAQLVLTAEVNA